jgi:hypothetical protein
MANESGIGKVLLIGGVGVIGIALYSRHRRKMMMRMRMLNEQQQPGYGQPDGGQYMGPSRQPESKQAMKAHKVVAKVQRKAGDVQRTISAVSRLLQK